jgi:hypothetical protein
MRRTDQKIVTYLIGVFAYEARCGALNQLVFRKTGKNLVRTQGSSAHDGSSLPGSKYFESCCGSVEASSGMRHQ